VRLRAARALSLRRFSAQSAAVVLLMAGTPLRALEPAQSISQYAHTAWSRENGRLPAGIRAIAQIPEGRLWLGTDSGLLQFDGVRFQSWKPPAKLSSDYVIALSAGRDGSLWIGTQAGLSQWHAGTIRNYQIRPGITGPVASAVLTDRTGGVWVAAAGRGVGGLCRVDGNALRCFGAADGTPGLDAFSLLEDRQGGLWVGGFGAGRWRPGAPRVYRLPDPNESIHAIAEDPEGQIWAAGKGLYKLVNGNLEKFPLPGSLADVQIRALRVDREGSLWLGTRAQGLIRMYRGGIERFSNADGLSEDTVHCLFEDREGNMWVGTDGGLDRFRRYAVTKVTRRDGISPGIVGSVFASRDGGLWIGTSAGLNRFSNGKIVAYHEADGLPSDGINSLFEQQSGRVWVMTNAGLAFSDGDRFHPVKLPDGQKISGVGAVVEDRTHDLWFSVVDTGLVRLRDTRIAEIIPWARFGTEFAMALELDHHGEGLWLGFGDGRVAHYSAAGIRWYRAGSGAVMDLHQLADGSLWIGTRQGLRVLRGATEDGSRIVNGLPCEKIRALEEDDRGGLWLQADCGLILIPQPEIVRWSAAPNVSVRARLFDAGDGVRLRLSSTGYFRRATKTTDGRLWFASEDRVAMVDPSHLPENLLPPTVKIEEITTEASRYPAGAGLRLPPRTKELRIDYTALSFVNPDKVQFRYLLEGFDTDWSAPTTHRQAVYTNLPPRNYRFRVIACNDNGVWNHNGESYDFSIAPAYYQTAWFQLSCLCAAALLLWRAHAYRLQRMAAHLQALHQERMHERTRISRDMHDTLVQDLAGITFQLGGLAKSRGLPDKAKRDVQEIHNDAQDALRRAREIVWDLRAPRLVEVDLFQMLSHAGEEIVAPTSIHFQANLNGNPRPASEKLQQQLLRIVQEALRNAVRYSRASRISLLINFLEPDVIHISMRDDGCGFDLESASRENGHWGLKTMRERAQQIGADFRISTAPGQGTEIALVVPCPQA
jgi:signal transduction histidine kinase/ligand-binding sensor domain-containing protein